MHFPVNAIRRMAAAGATLGLAATAGLVGLTSAPVAAAGTTYHVDCSATINGTGSAAAPLNSMPAANAVSPVPGDSILFRRGTTCTGQLFANTSGTAAARITYGAYGEGAKPAINAFGNRAAVWLKNASHVTVRDLDLQAPGDNTQARRGAWLQAVDSGDVVGVELRGLDIHDVRGKMPITTGGDSFVGKMADATGGIVVEALGTTTPSAFVDLVIEDNTVTSVDRQGIYFWSNWCRRPDMANFWQSKCTANWHPHVRPVVRGNTVSDVGGDGIVVKTARDGLVEHNSLQDFNMRAGSVNAGIWTANTDDMLFQFNRSAGGNTTADGNGYDVDHSTNRAIFQYNVSYDNDGGFFLICPYGENVPGNSKDFIIRHNLSVNDRARTFQVCGGGVVNGKVYNNTIFLPQSGSGTHHIVIENSAPDRSVELDFRNNIFMRHQTGQQLAWSTNDSAVVGSHNVFHNVPVGPGFTQSQTTAPRLTLPGIATTDPALYRPRSDSPVLDAGIAVAGAPGVDFFGTPVTSPPSIGFAQR